MATVVRIKRRRDEDPMEVLYLNRKKQKILSDETDTLRSSNFNKLFKFAGTVNSKNAAISKHVRDAIRKDKLEKEYKQHQVNILGEVRNQSRLQNRQQSKQSRFKVTAKHRTLELDNLDTIISVENETVDESTAQPNPSDEKEQHVKHDPEPSIPDCHKKENICQMCGKQSRKDSELASEKRQNRNTAHVGSSPTMKGDLNNPEHETTGENQTQNANTTQKSEDILKKTPVISNGDYCSCNSEEFQNEASEKDTKSREGSREVGVIEKDADEAERLFCLVDMESDTGPSYESMTRDSTSEQITCNSEPMIREILSERGNEDDYVYDLYYTNSRDFDFRMFEHDLTFEAFNYNLMYDREMPDDELEFVNNEDNDDENAESNWRNDYPEEDPRFIENREANYYGNDIDDAHGFETETGDQLADWMSWRCNIEDGDELSSEDDAVERYDAAGGPSYEAYYKRVRKEMGEGDP